MGSNAHAGRNTPKPEALQIGYVHFHLRGRVNIDHPHETDELARLSSSLDF